MFAKLKKASLTLFALFLTFAFSLKAEASSIKTFVNTKPISFTNSPIVENGRTLVEFRPIFQALGLTVEWNSSTKTIVGKNNTTKIQLTLGSKTAFVNGKKVPLEVAPKTVKGRTLVPLRFISDSTNAETIWHGSVNEIDIYSKGYTGAKRTPSKSIKAARGTKWGMSVTEVQKIEKEKLINSYRDSSSQFLEYYPVGKYGYKTKLVYVFENDSLNMIYYDFLPNGEFYHNWYQMESIHNKLTKSGNGEYGKGFVVSDDFSYISTLWHLGSSDAFLIVGDKNLYTSAKLIYITVK